MNINEIVVLTTFARYDHLKRAEGTRRCADLYRAPTFDSAVANSVVTDLLNRSLLEQNGLLLQVTPKGFAALKNNYSDLDRITSAVQTAIADEVG